MVIGAESELDIYSCHVKLQRFAALFLTTTLYGIFPSGLGEAQSTGIRKIHPRRVLAFIMAVGFG
jgi:hypothetical protein